MDRIIELVVAATVTLLLAVFVIGGFLDFQDYFGNSADNQEEMGCEYQENKIDERGGNYKDFSEACRESDAAESTLVGGLTPGE